MMNPISQAERAVIVAADEWARDVLRKECELNPLEQSLLDKIIEYTVLLKKEHSLDTGIPEIPKAPNLPNVDVGFLFDRSFEKFFSDRPKEDDYE